MIAALRAAGLPPWLLLLGAGVLVGAGGLIWLRSQADAVETEKAATAQAEARAATSEAQADLNAEGTRTLERVIERRTHTQEIIREAATAIEAAQGAGRLISPDGERELRAAVDRLHELAAAAEADLATSDPGVSSGGNPDPAAAAVPDD